MNIHALSGIRTLDFSNKATAVLRLKCNLYIAGRFCTTLTLRAVLMPQQSHDMRLINCMRVWGCYSVRMIGSTLMLCSRVFVPSISISFSRSVWKSTISFVLSLRLSFCPYVRLHKTQLLLDYFHEIWYLNVFRNSVEKVQVSLKSGKNKGCLQEDLRTFMTIFC